MKELIAPKASAGGACILMQIGDCNFGVCGDCNGLYAGLWVIQGAFFNCSSKFSVPKWKTMDSQSEILFHEILNVQKILIGWTKFFFLALKFGQTS